MSLTNKWLEHWHSCNEMSQDGETKFIKKSDDEKLFESNMGLKAKTKVKTERLLGVKGHVTGKTHIVRRV